MNRVLRFLAGAFVVFSVAVFNVLPARYPYIGVGAIALAVIGLGRLRPAGLVALACAACVFVSAAILTPVPELITERVRQRCSGVAPDAVIALAGDVGQDRIIQAIRMFRRAHAAHLFVTGSSAIPDGWRYYDTAVLLGLADQQLRRIEVTQGGTHGEALALRADAVGQRVHRLMVVTSPAHSARAVSVFRRAGYDACAEPTAAIRHPDPWGRIILVRDLIHETAAWGYYAARGWV